GRVLEKFPYPPFLLQRLRRVTLGGACARRWRARGRLFLGSRWRAGATLGPHRHHNCIAERWFAAPTRVASTSPTSAPRGFAKRWRLAFIYRQITCGAAPGGYVFGSTLILDQAHQAVAIAIEGITNDSTHGLDVEAAAPPQLGLVGDVLAPILEHLREAALAVERRQIKHQNQHVGHEAAVGRRPGDQERPAMAGQPFLLFVGVLDGVEP